MTAVAATASVLPDWSDVEAANARLAGHALRTPVLRSPEMDAWVGAQVYFKCENLQRTGAFKFRGAFNALARFDAGQRKRGAVAFSGGNHALGMALAGQILGIPVTVVMPHDAQASKVDAARRCGAQIDHHHDCVACCAEDRARQQGRSDIDWAESASLDVGEQVTLPERG